jgi:diketogulonate reductase-like aldo/keto reductase
LFDISTLHSIGLSFLSSNLRDTRKHFTSLALRWTLDQPFVNVALWGARHPNQLAAVADVTGWKLDTAALKAVNEIVQDSMTDPVGPEFMASPARPAHRASGDSRLSG